MLKPSFPHQLFLQAYWLTKIRWLIGLGTLLAVASSYFLRIADLNFLWLTIIAFLIFPINALFVFHLKSIQVKSEAIKQKYLDLNVNLQISIDFLILTSLIHLSGGIENPAIIFYVFHMIIGSIILPIRKAVFQALLAIFLFSTLTALEYFGILPHYSLNPSMTSFVFSDPLYLVFAFTIFAFASLLVVYFAGKLALRLRNAQAELKILNNELLQKDEIKNEYVQRLTHDIKGDLSTIHSCLTVVNNQVLAPVDNKNMEFVEKAHDRTSRLMEFVEDLLKLTNMLLNKRFDTIDLKINSIVKEVVSQIQSFANEKNIKLKAKITDLPLIMSGIEVSIREAIYNVVYNAVKYTPNNGSVNVTVEKVSGKIKITVADNGFGIPPESIPRIFDEFYRAENIKDQKGTGLGLSLVKAIIKRHSGKIDVQSTVNKGTVFTIWFNIKRKSAK
jgi:signal transduction histidine kinase